MLLRILILFVSAFTSSTFAAEWETNPNVALPPGMVACPRSDPNRNDCVKKMVQTMIPNLKNGYEPFGLKPIDPYFVRSVNFNYRDGDIMIRAQPRNLTIRGISHMKVRGVRTRIDDHSMHLELDAYVPKLLITGVYRADGNFNQVKVKAKGHINITVTGITATLVVDGATELRNGEKYMNFNRLDAKPKIRGINFYATGLFPDREFNNFVLELINNSWEVVFERLLPESKPIWEPLALDLLNAMIGRVPFKRISPP